MARAATANDTQLPGFDSFDLVEAQPARPLRPLPPPSPPRSTIVPTSDDDLPTVEPGTPFRVEVRRSARRTRSVGANLIGDVLQITVPTWMSKSEEAHWVGEMSRRYFRRHTAAGIDLFDRAVALARRYDMPKPRSVRWVDMDGRWGSCTPSTGAIRVSRRVALFPPWVLDYVLVHEVAHLEVLDHNAAFWRLVARYPKSERAIGYLIAKSGDDE